MAFYALWKWFRPWSKTNYPHMCYWYSEYVLKTPEQREKEKQERRKECVLALAALMRIGQLYKTKADDLYPDDVY